MLAALAAAAAQHPHACAEDDYALLQLSAYMPVYSDTAYIQPHFPFPDQNNAKPCCFDEMLSLPLSPSLVYMLMSGGQFCNISKATVNQRRTFIKY